MMRKPNIRGLETLRRVAELLREQDLASVGSLAGAGLLAVAYYTLMFLALAG